MKKIDIKNYSKGSLTEGEIKGNIKPFTPPIVQTAPPPPPSKPKS